MSTQLSLLVIVKSVSQFWVNKPHQHIVNIFVVFACKIKVYLHSISFWLDINCQKVFNLHDAGSFSWKIWNERRRNSLRYTCRYIPFDYVCLVFPYIHLEIIKYSYEGQPYLQNMTFSIDWLEILDLWTIEDISIATKQIKVIWEYHELPCHTYWIANLDGILWWLKNRYVNFITLSRHVTITVVLFHVTIFNLAKF